MRRRLWTFIAIFSLFVVVFCIWAYACCRAVNSSMSDARRTVHITVWRNLIFITLCLRRLCVLTLQTTMRSPALLDTFFPYCGQQNGSEKHQLTNILTLNLALLGSTLDGDLSPGWIETYKRASLCLVISQWPVCRSFFVERCLNSGYVLQISAFVVCER